MSSAAACSIQTNHPLRSKFDLRHRGEPEGRSEVTENRREIDLPIC